MKKGGQHLFLSLFFGRGIKKLDSVQWKVEEKHTNSFYKDQYSKNKTNTPYCITLFSSIILPRGNKVDSNPNIPETVNYNSLQDCYNSYTVIQDPVTVTGLRDYYSDLQTIDLSIPQTRTWASLVAQTIKNLPAIQETWV